MRTIFICLLLCLLPWTVRAVVIRDTLKNNMNDSVLCPPWTRPAPDSIRIHPEPWPDSALVERVRQIVDSALNALRIIRVDTTTKIDTVWRRGFEPVAPTGWWRMDVDTLKGPKP